MKNKISLTILLFLLIQFVFSEKLFSQVTYTDPTNNAQIGEELFLFEDKTNTLKIYDIVKSNKFEKSKKNVPNYGITTSAIWAKITITNKTDVEQLILQLNQAIIDSVEFYIYNPTTKDYDVIKMGEYQPFHMRKYMMPEYLFDIRIPEGQTKTCYLKMNCKENMQIPISVGTRTSIFKASSTKNIASGIYVGIMIVMILYNLFIFGIVRDKSYLFYSIYIIFTLLTQTSLQGFPFQYLWPEIPALAIYSPFLFPSLVSVAGLEFFIEFLQLRVRLRRAYIISRIFIIPYIISITLSFLRQYGASFMLMEISSTLVSLFMLAVAFIVYRQGNQEARFFLVGWSLFLIGVIIYVLKDFEILPYNNFTRYTMHFGSGLEVILLSFALADRINILKKEKEDSQAEALEALQENEKLITEQNVMLEQKVHERTEELEDKNTELGVTLNHLKETQSQLVVVEKMASLGQLTAGIAHEINNPINFVSANIKPLQMDISDLLELLNKYESITEHEPIAEKLIAIEKFKKDIDLDYVKVEINSLLSGIEDGAKRTAEIVKGLKNFSHLDESDIKDADVNKGIESTLILLRSTMASNIEINKNLGNLPLIECYPGKLNQVFMNILNNAIQAMEKNTNRNKHTLSISTYLEDEHVHIQIEDTGCGMTESVKEKIFEPFFTTKDVGEGTGLGMSIVFGIIESHNGKIKIDSEVGRGTRIVLILPLKLNLVEA